MENRYFAITGNEFGVHLDESIRFVTLEEAEMDYRNYLAEYDCALLYELRDEQLIRIKGEAEF